MSHASTQEEEFESRWEAAPAVGVIIALQALLAGVSLWQGWSLWVLPWWVWLGAIVPELVLLVFLASDRPRQALERMDRRRTVSITLLALRPPRTADHLTSEDPGSAGVESSVGGKCEAPAAGLSPHSPAAGEPHSMLMGPDRATLCAYAPKPECRNYL
jgi:hypothetical protein